MTNTQNGWFLKQGIVILLVSLFFSHFTQAEFCAPRGGNKTFTELSAMPLVKQDVLLSTFFGYLHIGRDPRPAKVKQNVYGYDIGLAYGATERLSLFMILSAVFEKSEMMLPVIGKTQVSVDGLGDALGSVRYTLYQRRKAESAFDLMPFIGTYFPTAKTNTKHPILGKLDEGLQLGSGTYRPFFGFSGVYSTPKWKVDAALRGEFWPKHNNYKKTPLILFTGSLLHALWPLQSPHTGTFFVGIDGSASIEGRETKNGVENPNSGAKALILGPVIQYQTPHVLADIQYRVPVLENYRGEQPKLGNQVTFLLAVKL